MGTKSRAVTPVHPGPKMNEKLLAAEESSARELAKIEATALQSAAAVARTFNYTGELTRPAVKDQIRRDGHNYAISSLAIGAGLLMLKELSPHGEFLADLKDLGHTPRSAQRFMAVALRISKSANLAHLAQLPGASQSKLIELMAWEDGQLDDLVAGKPVLGITLDKFQTMTATELHAQVLQYKSDAEFEVEKRQKVETERDALLKKLRGKVPEFAPMDERLAPFQKEITERHSIMEKCVMADVEALKALEVWWDAEAAEQAKREGLEADEYVPMPPAARAVLLHLDGAVARLANWVGLLQHQLQESFANELQQARQYLMQEPEGDQAAQNFGGSVGQVAGRDIVNVNAPGKPRGGKRG